MICVYHARDFGEADIVAAWLEEQGLAVHVKDRLSAGIFGPLAGWPIASAMGESIFYQLEKESRKLDSPTPEEVGHPARRLRHEL